MLRSKYLFFTLLLIFQTESFPQSFSVDKVEPPNWWSGFNYSPLQIMIYGSNLDGISAYFEDERIKVTAVHPAESNSYAFVDVLIPENLPAAEYNLLLEKDGKSVSVGYPILKRNNLSSEHNGFSNSDVIYLITPDRYTNGNVQNDYMEGQVDKFSPGDLDGRKGGDLSGIISRLDYIQDLGFTAVWITPVLENRMYMSYHGYAATDLYNVDPRFGSNEEYKALVQAAHQKGIKVIYDHVSNHIGINHSWASNPPFSDWFNGSPANHLSTNHNKIAVMDNYSDTVVVKINEEGWFTNYMPDLNQRNKFLSKYLIQNTLWWIEYSGLDGIREDTYPYANQHHMSEWAKVILNEYPRFNIVAEVWKGEPLFLSAYQKNPKIKVPFESNAPALTDFGLSDALRRWLSGSRGLYDVYETLVMDYVYSNPSNLVTFLDNHDITRALYTADTNYAKYKTALTILLTTRGIPQIYYGSEIGIIGAESHGTIRSTFPGGFPKDERDAFTKGGRTEVENDIFNHLKSVLTLRKKYEALQSGKLTHFPPHNGIYYYFREADNQKLMIAVNENSSDTDLNLDYIKTQLTGFRSVINLRTGKEFSIVEGNPIKINGVNADIFLLQ